MPVSASAAMALFVQARISALLTRPDAWGPPLAVELQLLLLIEMWHIVSGAGRVCADGVTERYDRFVGTVLPGPPFPLATRLGLSDRANDRFVELLRDFLSEEQTVGRDGGRIRASAPALPTAERVVEA